MRFNHTHPRFDKLSLTRKPPGKAIRNLFLQRDYSRSRARARYITPTTTLIKSTSTINIIIPDHLLSSSLCRNAALSRFLSSQFMLYA